MKSFFTNFKEKIKSKYQNVRGFFKETYNKHIIYMYIVASLLITLVIEMLARGSIWKSIFFLIGSPYVFICNAIIVLMTFSFSLLVRRRFFMISIISFVWLILGVINWILLNNRVTPLTGVDFTMIGSLSNVINKYFSVFQIIITIVLLLIFIVLLVFACIKAPKVNHKIKYIRNIFAIILIWAIGLGSLNLGVASGLIPTKFGNLRDCYNEYGFVYCFTNSLLSTGVSKPKGYSNELVQSITKENTGTNKEVKIKPNIVFVQLESFFDMKKMKGIEFSVDPIPTFTQLKKDYPSGYLNVPIIGAGTVNTEFEIMTGMNLDDFGPGEYPFKTKLVKETCESICYNLKEYGYKCHVVHNNTAFFYGRNKVFANLGYDTFVSIENMYVDEFTSVGWAKDKYLVDEIKQVLESTSGQDFVYGISVQGHGSYPTNYDYDYPITIKADEDEDRINQLQYYAWQLNEMDKFISDLIDEVNKLNEETIIVFYGDHLPSLEITTADLENKDIYQTEYVIWSNFDIGYKDENIEAYQLQAKILEKLNMNAGSINYYNQNHRHDKDKNAYLEGLHTLVYDMLYGNHFQFNGKNPYEKTNLKMGIRDIKINSINPSNDEVGSVYVYGENFTEYSNVNVNEIKQDTKYIDSNTLVIEYPKLANGDIITISQISDDNFILSTTEDYVYAKEHTNLDKE